LLDVAEFRVTHFHTSGGPCEASQANEAPALAFRVVSLPLMPGPGTCHGGYGAWEEDSRCGWANLICNLMCRCSHIYYILTYLHTYILACLHTYIHIYIYVCVCSHKVGSKIFHEMI
jgi:hypothetical protein